MLKKRLFADTALVSGVAAIPVPGADVAVNTALLVHEVRHYINWILYGTVIGLFCFRLDSSIGWICHIFSYYCYNILQVS